MRQSNILINIPAYLIQDIVCRMDYTAYFRGFALDLWDEYNLIDNGGKLKC